LLKRFDLSWPDSCLPAAARSFLAQIGPRDLARIKPHLEAVEVTRGDSLFPISDVGEHIYFPQGPLISLEQQNGVEVALVGSEGLVGWPGLVGCATSPYRAVVRGRDGILLRVRTEVFRPILVDAPAINLLLHSFVNVITVQMGETIGAFASHRLDMRLSRWILIRHDRVGGDEIMVQHDEIAANLGSRRASITDCLHLIEGDGLVRCRRGRIFVRDRRGLEEVAAGCYGAAEACYRTAIGSFGKLAPLGSPRVLSQRQGQA
jgi:CRP-like cAMP-binding protein